MRFRNALLSTIALTGVVATTTVANSADMSVDLTGTAPLSIIVTENASFGEVALPNNGSENRFSVNCDGSTYTGGNGNGSLNSGTNTGIFTVDGDTAKTYDLTLEVSSDFAPSGLSLGLGSVNQQGSIISTDGGACSQGSTSIGMTSTTITGLSSYGSIYTALHAVAQSGVSTGQTYSATVTATVQYQ